MVFEAIPGGIEDGSAAPLLKDRDVDGGGHLAYGWRKWQVSWPVPARHTCACHMGVLRPMWGPVALQEVRVTLLSLETRKLMGLGTSRGS